VLSDKIVTLNLARPLSVQSGANVRQVIETVQRHQVGAVIVCEGTRPIGIMTERDVLMKIVRRDVDYDEAVDKFMTPAPLTLTAEDTLGDAIRLMNDHGFRNIPIVDARTGEVTALFHVSGIIHHLAESFPEHVLNLPPRPHQQMQTQEGA
jgi:CBS domain-containing protein